VLVSDHLGLISESESVLDSTLHSSLKKSEVTPSTFIKYQSRKKSLIHVILNFQGTEHSQYGNEMWLNDLSHHVFVSKLVHIVGHMSIPVI